MASNPNNPIASWRADTNGDGDLSLADVPGWFAQIFFLPGDWTLWAVIQYAEPLRVALGLSSTDFGGLLSGFISSVFWLIAFIAALIAHRFVKELDRRVTASISSFASAARLRLRIARAVWRQRWQSFSWRKKDPESLEMASTLELSTRQLEALRLHAELSPGYSLPVNEVAEALGARVRPTEDLLDGLKRLGLLHRALSTADGRSSYTLTHAGRGLLAYEHLSQARTPRS